MSQISCSICYDLISQESILLHLDCGHIYHDNCLSLWMESSKTCPDCRKCVSQPPSRVYPNLEEDSEKLQLLINIKVLESENKKLEKMAQLYIDSKRINEDLIRVNDNVTERLTITEGKLNRVDDLLLLQETQCKDLTFRIGHLEKQLQSAKSEAQIDRCRRIEAVNGKYEALELLNKTQRRLLYAENAIDQWMHFVQTETVPRSELERVTTENQLQMRIKDVEQTISKRDSEYRGMGQDSEIKEIVSERTICSNNVTKKRKQYDC